MRCESRQEKGINILTAGMKEGLCTSVKQPVFEDMLDIEKGLRDIKGNPLDTHEDFADELLVPADAQRGSTCRCSKRVCRQEKDLQCTKDNPQGHMKTCSTLKNSSKICKKIHRKFVDTAGYQTRLDQYKIKSLLSFKFVSKPKNREPAEAQRRSSAGFLLQRLNDVKKTFSGQKTSRRDT
ncbi:hypothetical protein WA026_005903 [Henosepilachna vigintioctopunctata]|uniref:Uncharacterized protein n=1 Tax=Henosepilachna vigintioctopunctata TaxID=420089 RepID=A0AAW1U371_9CUCU